jgi:hypothetical protein
MTDSTRVDWYKRGTDTAGPLIAIVAVVIAVWAYQATETVGRLQRTLNLLNPPSSPGAEKQRRAMLQNFPDRWVNPIKDPLPYAQAEDYFKSCREKPDSESCKKWDVARRHLNEIEPLAFAYVHGIGDKRILAAATCVYMARSYRYFEHLIEVLRKEYNAGHSWQVIRQAVMRMENKYGLECTRLHEEIDARQKQLEKR